MSSILFLILFFSSLFYCSSEEIINLTNFEVKNFTFSKDEDYKIFSYSPSVRVQDKYNSHNIYIYDNLAKIKKDSSSHFTGYIESGKFSSYSDVNYDIVKKMNANEIYYFVIQDTDPQNIEYNCSIRVYSTNTPKIITLDYVQIKQIIYSKFQKILRKKIFFLDLKH